jgi:hypothetical protein
MTRTSTASPSKVLSAWAADCRTLGPATPNELGNDPDQLPVVQHALMRTWDYWVGERDRAGDPSMDYRHYEAIGTMDKALSEHADEA